MDKIYEGGFKIITKEDWDSSGGVHPDIAVVEERRWDENEGSRPLNIRDMIGKGVGPALTAKNNFFTYMLELQANKFISYWGDFAMSTKAGSFQTDGRKLRVKHIVAEAAVIEGYAVRPHDHVLKIDQYAKGAIPFTVLLPDLEGVILGVRTAVGIPYRSQSYTAVGAAGDNQVDRQFWGRELYIDAWRTHSTGDVHIRQGLDITQAGFEWVRSAFDQDEWYLTNSAGGNPAVTNPVAHYCLMDGVIQGFGGGGPGTLVNGQYGFGDADGLGFNTIYIWSAVSPKLRSVDLGYGLVSALYNTGETVHLVSYWNETTMDAAWNILCICRPELTPETTIVATTDSPFTIAPTTQG